MHEESLAKTTYWKHAELARDVTFLQLAFAKATIALDEDAAVTVLKNLYKTFEICGVVTPQQSLAHTALVMADTFGIKAKTEANKTPIPIVVSTPEDLREELMRSGLGTTQVVGVAANAYDKFRSWLEAAP